MLVAAVFACGLSLAPRAAAAATDADKAALKQATASCKADVKEYAKFNETSWWQRHKMVQKCVKEALAKK
jgi:stress-induced morphogen